MPTQDIVAKFRACRTQLTQPGAPFEIGNVTVGGHRLRAFKNAPATVRDLIDEGRKFGDKTFLVYNERRLSFTEFFAETDALAAQLQARCGVAKGDRVAIAMRNCPEWMVAFAAVVSIGAIAVPLNSWGQREELRYGLADSEPHWVICDVPRLEHIAADLEGLALRAIVVGRPASAADDHVIGFEDLLVAGGTAAPVAIAADEPVMIMYTSGTSGAAKGALSSHRAFCQAMTQIEYTGAIMAMTSPQRIQAMIAAGREPAALLAVPLFHVGGMHAQFLANLRAGRKMVILHKWDAEAALDIIAREGITQISGSPAMMLQLLTAQRFDHAAAPSLAAMGFGGSGLPRRPRELALEKMPRGMIGIGYGMTETNATAASFAGDLFVHKPDASGLPSPISELRFVDEQGRDVAPGQPGEIWIRGVTNMMGYWRNEAATREAMVDSWYRSGDVGFLDDEGFLFVVDRIKDIVNRGGEKIAAAEVESCIQQLHGVAEVAVFAVPDATMGEAVAAVVVLREGQTLSADQVRAHVAAHLAGYKVPNHVMFEAGALPRNAVGKLMKQQLRKRFA